MVLVALVFNFTGNNFVKLWQLSYRYTLKKTYQTRWISVQPFKSWRWKKKKQHFQHLIDWACTHRSFIISRKVRMRPKYKKALRHVWRRCCDWSKVSKVVCEVSCWRFLTGWCSAAQQTTGSWQAWNRDIENNRPYSTRPHGRQWPCSKCSERGLKTVRTSLITFIAVIAGLHVSLAEKTFCTLFPHVILCLNITKMFHF